MYKIQQSTAELNSIGGIVLVGAMLNGLKSFTIAGTRLSRRRNLWSLVPITVEELRSPAGACL